MLLCTHRSPAFCSIAVRLIKPLLRHQHHTPTLPHTATTDHVANNLIVLSEQQPSNSLPPLPPPFKPSSRGKK
jgi:hypothetical protein